MYITRQNNGLLRNYPNIRKLIKQIGYSNDVKIILDKPSEDGDIFLGARAGICMPAVSIIINSKHYEKDIDAEYIISHELLHHYLITEKEYPFYSSSEEQMECEDIYTTIYSFSHHFSIDNILVNCGLKNAVDVHHVQVYESLKKSGKFNSIYDEVLATTLLLEADYWLKNNAIGDFRKTFNKRGSGVSEALIEYHLSNCNDDLITPDGAKRLLKEFPAILGMPVLPFIVLQHVQVY